jgi:hypothetical protein
VDAVVGDADIISRQEDVSDGRRAGVEATLEREDTLLEVSGILSVWISCWGIQVRNLVALAVYSLAICRMQRRLTSNCSATVVVSTS